MRDGEGDATAIGTPSYMFYLLSPDGHLPSKDMVRQACESVGGELWDEDDITASSTSADDASGTGDAGAAPRRPVHGKFAFAFVPQGAARRYGGAGQHGCAAGQLRRGGGRTAPQHTPGVAGSDVVGASFESGHALSF